MDASLLVLFDGQPGVEFTQGEDRTIQLLFRDQNTGLPIDLTGCSVFLGLPRQGGGNVKRGTTGPVFTATQVVIANSGSQGFVNLPDHGLVDGDPFTIASSGTLPTPLAALTNYTVKVIDDDNFYVLDSTGAIVSLTAQGTGSNTMTNTNPDLALSGTPTIGTAVWKLRAAVSAAINAALAQSFQASYVDGSGKTRIAQVFNLLDVFAQPDP